MLTNEEISRYSRQLIIPQYGIESNQNPVPFFTKLGSFYR